MAITLETRALEGQSVAHGHTLTGLGACFLLSCFKPSNILQPMTRAGVTSPFDHMIAVAFPQ